ncbi:MAG: DNA polymerase IV [Pseudomonadota bacterium]
MSDQEALRKIVHVDMDAFYASVEQRDRPELRGKPVVVAWLGRRSVVCAASYEARPFGIHSAMPASRAERLCPSAVFVRPDFKRYREVSRQVREIFLKYTELVEPLSLDEAYLDVSRNKLQIETATKVAKAIREDILARTKLTASAGVAPNKFLAKIASDWRKPNGLFVIQPHEVEDFLTELAVKKLPGVGRATAEKLTDLGISTVGELREIERTKLQERFGKFGSRLHDLAHGIDNNPVAHNRVRKSLSVETTFERDRLLSELETVIDDLAGKVWKQANGMSRQGRTVVLKLRTHDFQLLTRSLTPDQPPHSLDELREAAFQLSQRVDLSAHTRYRLVGVGLTNFTDMQAQPLQSDLF